jgi:HSP20 family protein
MNKMKKMMLQNQDFERQHENHQYQGRVPTIFDLINRPLDDLSLFSNFDKGTKFKVDIEDKSDHYELKADLPGVNKADLKLNFNEGVLSIKANHHSAKEEQQEHYLLHERIEGSYERSFSFEDVDAQNIEASFNDGELSVKLPKRAKAQEHAIKIN